MDQVVHHLNAVTGMPSCGAPVRWGETVTSSHVDVTHELCRRVMGPVDLRTYRPSPAVSLAVSIIAGRLTTVSRPDRPTLSEFGDGVLYGMSELLVDLVAAETGLSPHSDDLVEHVGEMITDARLAQS